PMKEKKGGRPPKMIKRDKQAGVRFTTVEYAIVKQKALKSGMRVMAYMREMSLKGQIIERLTPEDRQILRQLAGIGNNLNQLVKKCNQEGMGKNVFRFEVIRYRIDKLLQQLRHDQ